MAVVSQAKAKEIMRHGSVRGNALTPAQKGMFGMIAGGGHPTRMHDSKRRKKGDRMRSAMRGE